MARIFSLKIEMFEPSETRPQMCVEVKEKVRTAGEHRLVHFGYMLPLSQGDVSYLADTVGTILTGIIARTIGYSEQLPF